MAVTGRLIEIAADIQPGDSGGPLVDTAGKVIGVDTAIHIGATGVLGILVQGTGATAQPGRHARLGYRHRPAAPGVVVTDVVAGSPAQQAGLAAGSVLVSLDGTAVDSSDTLITALSAHHPGDSVQVVWADRSSDRQSATVTLAPGPPN